MNRAGLIFVFFVFVWIATAGDGSNLGGQATHYEPPVLTGTVTLGANPVENAVLTTLAGHQSLSDSAGLYLAVLDAPGVYRVTARSALNSDAKTVEVFIGQTAVLDFDLGTPCSVTTWPEMDTVLDMVTCINDNQN